MGDAPNITTHHLSIRAIPWTRPPINHTSFSFILSPETNPHPTHSRRFRFTPPPHAPPPPTSTPPPAMASPTAAAPTLPRLLPLITRREGGRSTEQVRRRPWRPAPGYIRHGRPRVPLLPHLIAGGGQIEICQGPRRASLIPPSRPCVVKGHDGLLGTPRRCSSR